MWLLLLAVSATLGISWADEPAPETAPSSPAEWAWQKAEEKFQAGQLTEAGTLLDDLLRLHPTHPHAIDARYRRGVIHLAAGAPSRAVPLLKAFIEARTQTEDGLTARLALGRAYLDLKKHSEALLCAEEILRAKKNSTPSLRVRALQLKARTLLAQKRLSRAETAAASAEAELKAAEIRETPIPAEVQLLKLDLKLARCRGTSATQRLREGQAKSEADRQGSCLLEAATLFQRLLTLQAPSLAKLGAQGLAEGFQAYREFCDAPPTPPEPRSQVQLARYRQELSENLLSTYRVNATQAQEFFKAWKLSAPNEMVEAIQLAMDRVSP